METKVVEGAQLLLSPFQQQFRAAVRAATPLIAVRTSDPAQTIEAINIAFNGAAPPMLAWDIVRGVRWLNAMGIEVAWYTFLNKAAGMEAIPTTPKKLQEAASELSLKTANLVETLSLAQDMPEESILWIHNAHLYYRREDVLQGIWNCRDTFKSNQRALVLLTTLGATLPPEIAGDVMSFDEPLPTIEELNRIIALQYDAVGIAPPSDGTLTRAVDAVCGLAAFPAEQVTAMSFIKRDGKIVLDTEALWERKRQQIEATPGLSVWRKLAKFDDIGGLDNLKQFMRLIIGGEQPPRTLVFLDEIEKSMAGALEGAGDSSGTSQEMHGTLLTEMENQNYDGLILVGPPGTCKSQFAKAAAGEAGIPLICFDLSAMKSKFVGSSNEQLNTALRVVRSVSQGRALFIATCNKIAALPPELKRRFKSGIFYNDLPTSEERRRIWAIYMKEYGIQPQDFPADDGWTGAEIKTCCSNAWRFKRSLIQAADYITPVARTNAASIEALRTQASGTFLSATYPGFYQYNRSAGSAPAPTKTRQITI
jgi:ATPase family protein associated with various cellular activities (AAA)